MSCTAAACSPAGVRSAPTPAAWRARVRTCKTFPATRVTAVASSPRPGRVLVKADYSQIELRIAAKVTGDVAMLDAYGRGDDLHVQTALRVLGVETPTKEQRQIAKSLNFGLLYGMGEGTAR